MPPSLDSLPKPSLGHPEQPSNSHTASLFSPTQLSNTKSHDTPDMLDPDGGLPQDSSSTSRRRRRRGVPHVCHYCYRTFKRSEHLDRHVRTHTKEKPFQCSCGTAFTRRDLLTRHQRISSHDGEVGRGEQISQSDLATTAAAESLSSLSGFHGSSWPQQPAPQPVYVNVGQPEVMAPAIPPDAYQSQPLIGTQLLDQGHDMTGLEQFREFADFLDGVGLPAEWSPYFHSNEVQSVDEEAEATEHDSSDTPVNSRSLTRPGTPFSSWLPSAPGHEKASEPNNQYPRGHEPSRYSSKITESQRSWLSNSLEPFHEVLDPDFRLPSRHALSRYITSYFEGFHTHMVFIHVPTWSLHDTPLELLLSMATLGAQYCFECQNAKRLFRAGKAILTKRLYEERHRFGHGTTNHLGINGVSSMHNGPQESANGSAKSLGPWEPIDVVRTLINLMGFATWEPKPHILQEAFGLQTLLGQVLRDLGMEEGENCNDALHTNHDSLHEAWLAWVRQESVRRAKLIAFAFIHIHSVAYNVYPSFRTNEVRLKLPCCTPEWKAPTAVQWQAAQHDVHAQQLLFQDALSLLLKNVDCAVPLDPVPSPIGNYVLLHGLLQRIYIVRDLSLPIMDSSASLPSEEVKKLERGLRSWTTNWQQAPESSLDPNNENGPIPFTSSSLLGLAYVRIYLNLGPYRRLETRDPAQIAQALSKCPGVERSDGVVSALLYATHALSIPIRLGVDRIARSQAFFWSVRHSLSGLECAVLLSKWLGSLQATIAEVPTTKSEDRIVHWVRCIVEEAYEVVNFQEEEEYSHDFSPQGLGFAVLKIWAHFFKSNTQWPFINIIGASLEKYREHLMAVG